MNSNLRIPLQVESSDSISITNDRDTNDSTLTNNTNNTEALKLSITTSNTNWHTDRALFYTYYSILYDTNLMSLPTMCIILLLGPLMISLPNVLIPLGIKINTEQNIANGRPPINGYSYLFFQIIYCILGYPTLAFQFFNPLRNLLPKMLLFTIVPIVILIFIVILYYFLLIGKSNNTIEQHILYYYLLIYR